MRISLRPYLPIAVFVFAYGVTTSAGALFFLTKPGVSRLWNFIGTDNAEAAAAIGTPAYLTLVAGPLIITPIAACLALYLCRSVPTRKDIPQVRFEASSAKLWGALALASLYCVYSLSLQHALVPEIGSYRHNILRRMFLFDHLGLAWFVCALAVIPICAVMFLHRLSRGKMWSDAAGLLVACVACDFCTVAIYTKSHILVFAIMLSTAVFFARLRLIFVPLICVASIAVFGLTEYGLSGLAANHASKEPRTYIHSAYIAAQAVTFRMASAVPYYVAIFSHSKERCGIEAHTVRRLIGVPDSACVIPTKVFPKMYPSIHWVTGYAAAGAPVSAYGELGLTWAIFVMALSGVCLGVLGAFIERGDGALFTAFGAASCVFAYYLSQLPFIGAFTYPHGLIFMTLAALAIAAPRFSVMWQSPLAET